MVHRVSTLALIALTTTLGTSPVLARVGINTEFGPSSSLVDYSFLLDPPAGKSGFLRVDAGGRFAWSSGRRARFWGVNISRRSVFVEDEAIRRTVDTLARSGVNLVRLEALDAPGGLFARGSSAMEADRLHTLDRWVTLLQERGIYYYLDLLDLRVFSAADGVRAGDLLGPGARPYAMFDPALLRLQKDFARRLLTRQNVFTGIRYVDDPALAMVEICNESGFFLRPDVVDRIGRAQRMASHPLHPYGRELQTRWNRWLRSRYGSRPKLRQAWGAGLQANEDPVRGTVNLPLLRGSQGGSRRISDYVRFLSEVQQSYFAEMRAYLRSLGLKVPVTGVTSNNHLPDATSWRPLDFTAGNYFYDHPTFAGTDWAGDLHFADTNPLRSLSGSQSAPFMAALRWGKKPAVVREWAQPWPNRYRAVVAPEVTAYASLQDMDGLLLFGYRSVPPISGRAALADFAHEADPTVWPLFGACGLAFRRADIRSPAQPAYAVYAPSDVFRWPATTGERLKAAWRDRVVSVSGARTSSPSLAAGVVVASSTGQIVRHVRDGVLIVNAPRFKAVAGEIGGKPWTLKDGAHTWRIRSRTPIGALVLQSLDDRPLATSQRWHAVMVTRADNTGQRLEPTAGGSPGRFRIAATGSAPVLTHGKPTSDGVSLERDGVMWLSLDLTGGAWEALVEGRRATIVCDTAGIRGRLRGRPFVTRAHEPLSLDL